MNRAKEVIRVFRDSLIEVHGFSVANTIGDLAREDQRVSTRYAGGEFYVTSWIRVAGVINRDSKNRRVVRVTDHLLARYPGYMSELTHMIGIGRGHEYNGPGANTLDRPKAAQP